MNKNTKIGLVLPSIPSYSETFFRSKIKGLQENGFEIILFVVDPKNKKSIDCKIIELPNYYLKNLFLVFILSFIQVISNLKTAKKLFDLCKKNNLGFKKSIRNVFMNSCFLRHKLDWLHYGFGTLAIGREHVAEAIDAKMAISFRGFDIGVYPIKNKNCYEKVWKNVDKIHVISDGIARLCLCNGLIDLEKVIKITPAIDTKFFYRKQNPKTHSSVINITSIARLHWIKGLEYTLEALAIVKNKNYNFNFTIIGDGVEKERLQFAAHQLGLTENVTFAGKLNPEKVKIKLEKTDIYLQYSNQEGFCNAVLEAQAMGLICIVSDAEGLSENIINNTTGFVVKKRNAVYLANKIIEVFKLNEIEKTKISNAAIQRINNEFKIEKQIEKFEKFYNS